MKYRLKRILSGVLAITLCMCAAPAVTARADSTNRIVTLGEDLSDEQRETVLDFFGLDEDDLEDMDVITIDNDMEHDLLDGIVASSIIGTKTYSCAYIQPNSGDVINVKTANLTYVTSSAIYNALQTAGVEGCDVIVTAPFAVSGTGALTGIFEAYDLAGESLDDAKEDLAAQELIMDSDLEEAYGESAADMVTEIKNEVASSDTTLTKDEIAEIIGAKAKEYGVTLSQEDAETLASFAEKLQGLDYDSSSFSEQAEEIINTVSEEVSDKAKESGGFWNFFQSIIDWFKSLFGMAKDAAEESGTDVDSIFDNIDTSVFQFDK